MRNARRVQLLKAPVKRILTVCVGRWNFFCGHHEQLLSISIRYTIDIDTKFHCWHEIMLREAPPRPGGSMGNLHDCMASCTAVLSLNSRNKRGKLCVT